MNNVNGIIIGANPNSLLSFIMIFSIYTCKDGPKKKNRISGMDKLK